MTLSPAAVLRHLTMIEPSRLDVLPNQHGIYALHDHGGDIRYIGITSSAQSGFFDRIHNRHAAGSEGRSHKFSHAYNVGRMWRAKRDDGADARLAKRLRNTFIRRHCRASFLPVDALPVDLRNLEAAVQSLASEDMLAWGRRRHFTAMAEPVELVDETLDELRFSREQRLAVERQAALHEAYAS
ncbi:hypothetical protein ABIE41_003783 [Bosea sp. OAE506]|uniref:hypothetical protein n=1 Tax=Bosea sp. OAE506 TaxID=2663870 RepID=UPI00178A8536